MIPLIFSLALAELLEYIGTSVNRSAIYSEAQPDDRPR